MTYREYLEISELIAGLSYFFRDNHFLELDRVRDDFIRERDLAADYIRAFGSASRILEKVNAFAEDHKGERIECGSGGGMYLNLVTWGETEKIHLDGILEWNNYGPIVRTDIGKETLDYFKELEGATFADLQEKLKTYHTHLNEILIDLAPKCRRLQTQLGELSVLADPHEYKSRLEQFNQKWQGIQLYAEVDKIPVNKIINPTFLSPYEEYWEETEREIKISNQFHAQAYVQRNFATIVDHYVPVIAGENQWDDFHMMVCRGEGYFRRVDIDQTNIIPYVQMLKDTGISSPIMVEVYACQNRRREESSCLRLISNKGHQDVPDSVLLANYAYDFEMFSDNIRRLGGLFRKVK